MTNIFFGDLASVHRHSMVYHIMLNKVAYGMQLNNFPQNSTSISEATAHSTISSKFTFFFYFLLSTRQLTLPLHSCSQMLCKYFFFFLDCVQICDCFYGTKVPLQQHPEFVVCCFSLALHRKTTPNSRQEGNQYCRNQYNTQYLAILSQESSGAMTVQQGSAN